MKTFKEFLTESPFDAPVKGEDVGGDGWNTHTHLGNHYYASHRKSFTDDNGTRTQSYHITHDYLKKPERQKGEYRTIGGNEGRVGSVHIEQKKGQKPVITANVHDSTMSVLSNQTHTTVHSTVGKALKHVLGQHAGMHAKAVDQAREAAKYSSHRHFSQISHRS